MKIVVTGASGQVGWELVRALQVLGEVVGVDQDVCDFTQPDALKAWMLSQKPDVIINAAAYTAVDKAEQDEATATTVNGKAVQALAQAAQALGALLVHYSTDYVFDGTKAGAYLETDPPCPLNAYGRSKLAGDEAIMSSGCDYVILRTTWVYASRGANFVLTMLRLARERESLRVVFDQIGAPTWARNIADATAQIVARAQGLRQNQQFASGLFNLSASGETSWHGFAQAVVEMARDRGMGENFVVSGIDPIPSSAYPVPAARPKNSRLDTKKMNEHWQLSLPDWRIALERCLEEIQMMEHRK